MSWARVIYAAGVLAGGLTGWLSPWPFLGFAPVAAGLVWAAYDLVEVTVDEDDAPPTPPRPTL